MSINFNCKNLLDTIMRNLVLIATCVTAVLGTLSHVLAEEVRIGHLETNDNTAINWLYFSCNKSTAVQMQCDIFQTVIRKKKSEAEFESELKQQASVDALAEFNKNFGEGCKKLVENEPKIQQAIKSGMGLDGKPINARVALSSWPMMKAIIEVCKNSTQESAARLFKSITEQEERTCEIRNDRSTSMFTLDPYTPRSRNTKLSGATWKKKLRTNPKGVLPSRQSCELLPELTLNYTWQTAATSEGCDFTQSLP